MPKKTKKKNNWKRYPSGFAKLLILVITAILVFISIVLPDVFNNSVYPLRIGEVATQEVIAPYSLSFESEELTAKVKLEAEASVDPIYLPADPSIGRHQIENLKTMLYYISTVRQDPYATKEEKLSDLESLTFVKLSSDSAERILSYNDIRWSEIENEASNVLEQVMRNTIRTSNLNSVKANIPSLVNFSFSEDQAKVVNELVSPFIVPNSIFSQEQTDEARAAAKSEIEPITRSFITGETIVRRGQLIQPVDWEALNAYGLIQPENNYQDILASLIIVIVLTIFIGVYFTRRKLSQLDNIKSVGLIALTLLIFIILARFFIINRTILPYIYPMAAFGLTLSVIFNLEIGIVFTLVLGILSGYGTNKGLDLTLFYIVPSLIGMLTIGKARRIASFFGAGVAIALAGVGIIMAYRLGDSVTDWIGIASLSAASLFNGIASASLTLILQFLFSQLLDVTTPLRLLDLARPDHPLLQHILRTAPGSYQHSLQVSNLAEQAAEAIGADALLVRVGAIYHDCGKSTNPQFFIENQVRDEINSHDDIDPIVAASTIIQHVIDGEGLAKKYRLPSRIIDFIKEHHGTLLTQYQYSQAIKLAEDPESIDEELFRYPGPSPRSKETALLMLADGMEARTRAELPRDEEQLRSLAKKVIEYYESRGQLSNTDLTLKDLHTILESFISTLQGVHHPRIQYPDSKKKS